tara:strand:- start:308 stop:925 length:618 start_codon:yes stop_codon:yes gene_type:complete
MDAEGDGVETIVESDMNLLSSPPSARSVSAPSMIVEDKKEEESYEGSEESVNNSSSPSTTSPLSSSSSSNAGQGDNKRELCREGKGGLQGVGSSENISRAGRRKRTTDSDGETERATVGSGSRPFSPAHHPRDRVVSAPFLNVEEEGSNEIDIRRHCSLLKIERPTSYTVTIVFPAGGDKKKKKVFHLSATSTVEESLKKIQVHF